MSESAALEIPAAVPVAESAAALEPRLRRLEETVAVLQDTQALEDRVAERVSQRMQGHVQAEAQRMFSANQNTRAVMAAAAAETAVRSALPTFGAKLADAPWLILELGREIVAIFRMFFDIHYKVAWTTRLLTMVLLPAILTSHWWLPFTSVPVVGEILDKLFDLALALVMYKALTREARRYIASK
jgi:hypothetical protein